MIGVLFASLAAGLTTVVFLIGFASVRLRTQHDRALSRADSIANALAQRSADAKVISDREIERTAEAYADAAQLDPMSKLTVLLTWIVSLLMIVLASLAAIKSRAPLTTDVSRWTFESWAATFVIAVAIAVATVGTIEYLWVRNDLAARLAASPMSQVQDALRLRNSENLEAALSTMNTLLAEFESWPWAFAFRSQLHASNGALDAAVQDLDRALQLEPENVWHRVARAELLMRQGQPQSALEDLDQLGPRMPNEPEVLRLHGSALLAVGRRDESLAIFARVLAALPGDLSTRFERARALSDLQSLDHITPSVALREIVLDEGQRVAVEALSNAAREHLVVDDLRTAVEDFTIVLEHDPSNVGAYALRGYAYARLGDRESSDKDFNQALSMGDRRDFVLRRMGFASRALGNLDEALKNFSESIAVRPTAVGHFQRGLIRDEVGEWVLAIEDFDASLVLRPAWSEAKTHRAVALAHAGRLDEADSQFREVERLAPTDSHNSQLWARSLVVDRALPGEAFEVVDRALSHAPDDANLIATRGRLHALLKRFASAHGDFEKAEAMGADATLLALDRARAFTDSGQTKPAIEALTVAADLSSPLQYAVLAARATLLRNSGLVQQALSDFDKAIELKPTQPELLVSRACLLTSLGEHEKAAEDLQRALDLEPANLSALWHRAQLHVATGAYESALADAESLELLGHENHLVFSLRGDILFGQGEWAAATTEFQRALSVAPPDQTSAYVTSLAVAFDNAGSFEDAEVLFRRLVSERPSPGARLRLGICLSQQNKMEEAMVLFSALKGELGEDAEAFFRSSIRMDILLEAKRVVGAWEASSIGGAESGPASD